MLLWPKLQPFHFHLFFQKVAQSVFHFAVDSVLIRLIGEMLDGDGDHYITLPLDCFIRSEWLIQLLTGFKSITAWCDVRWWEVSPWKTEETDVMLGLSVKGGMSWELGWPWLGLTGRKPIQQFLDWVCDWSATRLHSPAGTDRNTF